MKRISINLLCILLCTVFILSCNKQDEEYGIPNIYMPQAVNISGGINANYPVPSGTDSSNYNYILDKEKNKVNVILGVARSGMQAGNAFTVNIVTNTDTVNYLVTGGVMGANSMLMPASMYTLPSSVDVAAGQRGETFDLSLDIEELKKPEYAGKKLVLAVSIQSTGKYTVAAASATTIVTVDVDALVIGPAVDVTSSYLKNTGQPFIAAAMSSGGRWGTLSDWTANTAAKSHGGFGGFASDAGGTMNMESGWGSPRIYNGKIYQSVTLPAGTYTFDASNMDWQGTKDPAYIIAAPKMDTIPDYSNVTGNTAVYSTPFTAPKITFGLDEPTQVTFGFVVNYVQDEQGFKILSIKLYNYPKHL